MQKQYVITPNEAEELSALREFFHRATGVQSWTFYHCKGEMRDLILGQGYSYTPAEGVGAGDYLNVHTSPAGEKWALIHQPDGVVEREESSFLGQMNRLHDLSQESGPHSDLTPGVNGHAFEDYYSPTLTGDHPGTKCAWSGDPLYTVLGYLAKHDVGTLMGIDDYPEATQRDGWWLTHRCKEQGIVPQKVEAPSVLKVHGINEVNAYPLFLLESRFSPA